MTWPVSNSQHTVNHPFGEPRDYDGDGVYDDRHEGLDIYARTGDTILPALPGTVVHASDKRRSDGQPSAYGWHVIVSHEGDYYETWYCHLESLSVGVGDTVGVGSSLGPAGTSGNSTGIHLHFNVRKRGYISGPGYVLPDVVDPLPLLEGITSP